MGSRGQARVGACGGCGREMALRSGLCGSCHAVRYAVACGRCGRVCPTYRRISATEAWCAGCTSKHDIALELVALRGAVIEAAAGLLIGVNADVGAAFDAAVAHRGHARGLLDALHDDPDVFAGSSTAPVVVDRFIAKLSAEGVEGLVPPRCGSCGGSKWLTQRVDGKRTCNPCSAKSRGETCSLCRRFAVVSTRNSDGTSLCPDCNRCAPHNRGLCIGCNRERVLMRRDGNGARVCRSCVERALITCDVCGAQRRGNNGTRGGQVRCAVCAKRRADCSVCGQGDRPVACVWASGPVCSTCRHAGVAARSICAGCGQRRRIDPRNTNGHAHCASCAGLVPFSVCRGCGTEDRIHTDGLCFGCLRDRRLDELIGRSEALEPVRTALRASVPRTVLRWLAAPVVAQTIAAMAAGTSPISHATLDNAGSNHVVAHLRAVLVEAGVLEGRDEQAARLEAFIDEQVRAVVRDQDRTIIEAFARWHVLRRHRQRGERRESGRLRVDDGDARNDVVYAVRFLDWLHENHIALAECSQGNVDAWVMSGLPSRRLARDFVRWAVKRRLATGIDIHKQYGPAPARSMTTHDATQLVRRFVSDDTIRLEDRVAGLLLLCFAQPLTRIVALRCVDIETRDGHEWVRLGDSPIELPEPIAVLARTLADSAHGHATTGVVGRSEWLFPGGRPGQPMTPAGLSYRLHAYNIDARHARTTAMLDLAAVLAPAVLADMIGLFPNTAVRWVQAAGGDWTTYVAERARHDDPSSLS